MANKKFGLGPLTFNHGEIPMHKYIEINAGLYPKKVAINFYGKEITYQELGDSIKRFASYLYSLGVRKGDRVALFLQSCPQYIISFYAVQRLGGIVCPCSPMFKEWELEFELNEIDAKTIVVLDYLYPIVEAVKGKTALKDIIVTSLRDFIPEKPLFPLADDMIPERKIIPGTIDFVSAIENSGNIHPEPEISMQDVSLLIFTSGTTGLPKGAMLTYFNSLYKIAATALTYRCVPEDIYLCTQPLFHIAGIVVAAGQQLYTGCTAVLIARYDPIVVMSAIDRLKCTKWYSSTLMNSQILEHHDVNKYDLTSLDLTTCTSYSLPLTKELYDDWSAVTKGAKLVEVAYGLSETHTMDTMMPLDHIKFGTAGMPVMDEMFIKIVNPETLEQLQAEESGEILVKNPGVMKGYWNNPEATGNTLLEGGWLRTGDFGKMDSDGYLNFLGRIKEMIKTSGFSVFPEEVEMYLKRHPAVAQVAVIGVPDQRRGEKVKAFIVLKSEYEDKVTEQEFLDWSQDKMAAYKRPREVEFRSHLPLGGSGKLLRRILRDEAREPKKSTPSGGGRV
jgi:long-chain acyl-CoA synthetase